MVDFSDFNHPNDLLFFDMTDKYYCGYCDRPVPKDEIIWVDGKAFHSECYLIIEQEEDKNEPDL